MALKLPDADWQRKVDEYNAAHGSPPIMVVNNPRAVRKTKVVWVQGVPVKRLEYEPRWQVGVQLDHKPPGMEKVAIPLDGVGDRWCIKLFSWSERDVNGRDVGFRGLDDRLFTQLRLADTARSHTFFEDAIVAPETKRKAEELRIIKDAVAGAKDYYWRLNNPSVSMNPGVSTGGDWRHRIR